MTSSESTVSGTAGAPKGECDERRYIGRMEAFAFTREEVAVRSS